MSRFEIARAKAAQFPVTLLVFAPGCFIVERLRVAASSSFQPHTSRRPVGDENLRH